jgi:hypothetical protein
MAVAPSAVHDIWQNLWTGEVTVTDLGRSTGQGWRELGARNSKSFKSSLASAN